jgi:filamentous hemagglutinin family protein
LGPAGLLRKAFHAVIPSALALLVIATGSNARADDSIKADTTLKSNNSVVTRSNAADGKTTYTITGGASQNSGRYLFHSFAAFNLLLNEVGHFDNLNTVNTIFSRVTGLSQSSINGLIKANGAANLYLINPKGIVFGPNARIDVGGAFKASTAEALLFNGQEFSAIKADVEPVLTSDIVPGLQFGATPATLSNAGVLVVKDGQEILLAGGPDDTVISSGTITANGGAIKLEGGNITVSGGGIQASNGGSINLSADKSISVSGPVAISAENKGSGKGGDINLTGPSITIEKGARINTQTTITTEDIFSKDNSGNILKDSSGNPIITIAANKGVTGDAGNINLSANNVSLKDNSLITTETQTTGKGGLISVDSNNLNLVGGSQLSTAATATSTSKAGDINLNASTPRELSISFSGDGSIINAQTVSQAKGEDGRGGDIKIGTASKTLSISGDINNQNAITRITAQSNGVGNGGSISLLGSNITITDKAKIITETTAAGSGGLLSVDAGALNLAAGSQLFSTTTGAGNGGSISLSTKSLQLGANTQIISSASGTGAGGAITVAPAAAASLQIKGPGLIETQPASSGVAGAIRIGSTSAAPGSTTASDLSLSDGVRLQTSRSSVDLSSTGTTSVQGGSIEALGSFVQIRGDQDVRLQGVEIHALNSSVSPASKGSISVTGGAIEVGKASGRTILRAGNANDLSPSETLASNLTLLDSAVSLTAAAGKSIEIYSGSVASKGTATLRASGANSTNPADANAVRLTTSGTGGNIVLGSRSANPSGVVSSTTIGDGVGITANDGSISFGTTGKISLGSGSQLQAGSSIDLRGNSTDEITTPFLNKIAGSSSWFIGQVVDVNSINYTPTSDRSLTINAPAITVKNFSLTSSASSWQMASGVALDLQATAAGGLNVQNLDLSFTRTGTGASSTSSDLFRATSEAGGTSISQGSKITAKNGGSIALLSAGTLSISGSLSSENSGSGSGGAFTLKGTSVSLNGGQVVSKTAGSGTGAAITVDAGSLELSGGSQLTTQSTASGAGGAIAVAPSSAAPLSITGSGLIETTATSSGSAGAIRIGTNGTSGSPIASSTTLSGGVRLKTSRSSVDLSSTGTTSLEGGSIEASGGSIKLDGTDTTISGGSLQADGGSITISGNNNTKLGRTSLTSNNGSISVNGGDIEVGSATGRTILLAGSGSLGADESQEKAPHLTLLDGGSGSIAAITLKGGENKAIQIFSGSALPATPQGISTVRGATAVTATAPPTATPATTPAHRIVVGGVLAGPSATSTTTSSATSVGSGSSLTANGGGRIDVLSTGAASSSGAISASQGTLNLKGSELSINGGSLRADDGSITVAGVNSTTVANSSTLSANGDGRIDVLSTGAASISGSLSSENSGSGSGGAITLKGTSVSLNSGQVISKTAGSGTGAAITVEAGSLELSGGSQLFSQTSGSGPGGAIQLNSTTPGNLSIAFSGDSLITSSTSQTGSGGGKGGDIVVGTANRTLSISGAGSVIAASSGSGNAGVIELRGSSVNLDQGAQLVSAASGAGSGGSINLSTKSLQLGDNSKISSSASGTGAGGAITVAPAAVAPLQIKGPGLIETQPASSGNAGAIRLGSTSADPGATTVSDLSLSDGVQLKTSRSSVELASTGTTSLQGGSITAAGSTVAIKGATSVAIQGTEISALNPKIGKPSPGSIAITGGAIKVGGETGRTLLRAGDAQDLSDKENNATNLTLLDGGTGDSPAIKLQGGANQAIKIYSVAAPLDARQGITTLRGANEAITSGGSINISGGTGVSIANANLYAPTATFGNISSQGSIAITGGAIKVGGETGRTLLRAGNARDLSVEEKNPVNNLTLLDSAITLTASAGKSIEVFSGTPTKPGITTLRTGFTNDQIDNNPNSIKLSVENVKGLKSGLIVVGGINIGLPPTPTTTSANTTLTTGTSLSAKDIYIRSSGTLSDKSKKDGSTNAIAAFFDLGRADLINSKVSEDNTYSYTATGVGHSTGYIKLIFQEGDNPFEPDINSSGDVAKMRFTAENNIEFHNVDINIQSDKMNRAGAFKLESNNGNIILKDTKLHAPGNNGSIILSVQASDINKRIIELSNSELNTSIIDGIAAGLIELKANNVDIKNSKIISLTTGKGEGGNINLEGSSINLDSSTFTVQTSVQGEGGSISLNSSDSINLIKGATINAQTEITTKDTPLTDSSGKIITDGDGTQIVISANKGSTGNAGDIRLFAKDISLYNSLITAETQTMGEGGLISVNSDKLNLSGSSQLTTEATNTSTSKAGDIHLNASTPLGLTISFSGKDSFINAQTVSQKEGNDGRGGDIHIGTVDKSLTITGPGTITAETMGSGKGGDINLKGSSINLDSSTFTVQTSGLGTGGSISLESSDSINLSNGAKINAQATKITEDIFSKDSSGNILKDSSGNPIIEIAANKGVTGDAGDIKLSANNVTLKDKSIITAETQTMGEGGLISVNSDKLNLSGGSQLTTEATNTSTSKAGNIYLNATTPRELSISFIGKDSEGNYSKINAQTVSQKEGKDGRGGDINIGTADKHLNISGAGSITAQTYGVGNGGNINLKGSSINLDSSTFTVQTLGLGTGGSISLNSSDYINLSNGAKINAQATKTTEDIFSKDSSGNPIIEIAANKGITGDAGNISISANNVTLKDKSIITAETQTSGIGGLISVNSDKLNLSGGSQLSTKATSTGNAGAINLNASNPRDLSIAFSGNSLINAATELTAPSGGQGGTIKLGTSAKNLSIIGQGFITAETKGSGNGGDITLEGRSINVDAAQLTAQTSGTGAGGIVRATANSLVLDNKAKLTTQTSSTGKGGEISLLANTISLNRGAIATAETTGSGLGGTITVDADAFNLYSDTSSVGSQLSTKATSTGTAGSIFLNVTTPRDLAITFSGDSLINAATELTAPGGGQGGTIKLGTSAKTLSISGQGSITAETKGSGNGGALELKGSSISLDNGATASAQTSGSGRSGTISVEAITITLDNSAKLSTRSSSASDASPQPTGPAGSIKIIAAGPNSLHLRNGSQISSDTSSTIAWANDNDLANIIINTPHLTLEGASSISASTSAAAKAGAINLISAFTELGGGSRIATASTGTGAGGNINIYGTRLLLNGASQFKADGGNFGQAGSINITLLDRLQLDNQSSINASTARSASKEGGANISITLGGDLLLNNGSSITATATGKANGGNIKLLLPNGFLLSSFPGAFAGNDILASADAGDGGRIELRALGIFGMNINTYFTSISEASAKSRSGRDGVLAFYIPYLTPDRGVVPIEQPLDPDNDLVRACSPRGDDRRAEFTQTGRGGQPGLPGDRPTAAPLLDDLGRPAPRRGLQTSASLPSTSQPAPAAAIPIASAIELQGYAPRLALPLPPCPEPR